MSGRIINQGGVSQSLAQKTNDTSIQREVASSDDNTDVIAGRSEIVKSIFQPSKEVFAASGLHAPCDPKSVSPQALGQLPPLHASSEDMVQALRNKVEAIKDLGLNRKEELLRSIVEMRADFTRTQSHRRFSVYLMEGATGVTEVDGRPSTDRDENWAIKASAFLVKFRNAPAVLAVPDAANQRQTMRFLQALGVDVACTFSEKNLQPGTIYVIRMDSLELMRQAVATTATGRDVFVLGPPSGYAHELLDDNSHVTFMGSATEANGTLVSGSLSTNTKDPLSAGFILAALKLGAKQISSRSMGPELAISLAELALFTSLFTEADKRHWSRNSWQQFLGIAPYHLLEIRLSQSGAWRLFETASSTPVTQQKQPDIELNPPGKVLAFFPLLSQMAALALNYQYLSKVCDELGPGYGFLRKSNGGQVAKNYLYDLVKAHHGDPHSPTVFGYKETCKIIEQMSDLHATHAFVAIVLAFKNIYDEKTVDGWARSTTPGQQWRADNFLASYMMESGKQIFYDALVILEPFIGLGTTEQEKAATANKALLILGSE